MKTKLTLSVDPSVVRKAKAHSKRRHKSVSEFFEEAVEKAAGNTSLPRRSWSSEWGGSLKLTDADVAGNDRLGQLIGRARTKATKRAKQRA